MIQRHEEPLCSASDLHELPTPSAAAAVGRSDVAVKLADLIASAEPAVVFTSLAKQCVPAFCDACAIEITETGRDAYRIHYPDNDPARMARVGGNNATPTYSLRTPVRNVNDRAPGGFTGAVIHTWDHHRPTDADATIAALMVDLAVTVIARKRLAADADRALATVDNLRTALKSSRHIGTALGILMATYKITDTAAFDLLRTVSQRVNRKLRDLADDVVRTGWLDPDTAEAQAATISTAATDPVDSAALLRVQLEATERRIAPRGELDLYTATALRDAVDVLVQSNPGDSTIDLAGVTFIDAGGIGIVVSCRNTLATIGATLNIVGASTRARKIFELAGLGELLTAS